MATHDDLCDAALNAIKEVHSDTSVPLASTKAALQTLVFEIEMLIAAVDCDLDAEEN